MFDLRMGRDAEELLWEGGRVAGVRVNPRELDMRADLTIAADGRVGPARDKRARRHRLGAPMDVLWLRLRSVPTIPIKPSVTFATAGSW